MPKGIGGLEPLPGANNAEAEDDSNGPCWDRKDMIGYREMQEQQTVVCSMRDWGAQTRVVEISIWAKPG